MSSFQSHNLNGGNESSSRSRDFNLHRSFLPAHLPRNARHDTHPAKCFKVASLGLGNKTFTMKFAPAFAFLVGSASAFTAPTMTFAVGKKSATKVVKKAAPKPAPAAKKAPPKAAASAVR